MLHAIVLAAALALTITFKGIVLTRSGNQPFEPVYGALVVLTQKERQFTAITMPDGSFEIAGLQRGSYSVSVTSNAGSTSGSVELSQQTESYRLYVFGPACSAIYGKVRDAVSGRPIAGATVRIIGQAYTDGNGDYALLFGCFSGPGFEFHNTFFYTVSAPRHYSFSQMGGRAEGFHGVFVRDFALEPILAERDEVLRPPPIP